MSQTRYGKSLSAAPLRTFLLLLGTALVSGCGYIFGDKGLFPDTSNEYRKARTTEIISVPEHLDGDALAEVYVVPPVEEELLIDGKFETPRPEPLVAADEEGAVRIQRLGEERWALVAEAPGQLWPQVRAFLTQMGYQVARMDASAGIMETDWARLAETTMDSRFRFRIEQGVQRGTSELHVLHMYRIGDGETWPALSADSNVESEMLQAAAQYIADGTENTPVSMVAEQAIAATGKVTLQEDANGEPFILLRLPSYRGWASLGLALENSGFEIDDRDRSAGTYYTHFRGPQEEKKRRFFGLLPSGSKHPLAGREVLVRMTEQSSDQLVIRLESIATDKPFTLRERQELLVLVKGNIS
jgi:outer membrane protein assembly factor BamC